MPSKSDEAADFAGDPPTDINPYEILSLAEDASEDDIKKAYRRAALKHHPDKVPAEEKESAKVAFQNIAFAYAVLSDSRRRQRYDSTGSTAETLDLEDDDFDWLAFFREQWVEAITPDVIEKHRQEYIESGEQRAALLAAYKQFKGNVDKIYEVVMHSTVIDDDARFREILDAAIANHEVPAYDKYTKETEAGKKRRLAKAEREAKEAEEHGKQTEKNSKKKKKGAASSDADLAALILGRQAERGSRFIEQLEEKYAGGKGKSKKRSEPPEEAFATAKKARK